MLNKVRLFTPGPTPLPERVRLAMAADSIHHRKPEFKAILANTQEKLKTLFGTEQPVLPLACSGSGAMTAAAHNLFAPGEHVIVVEAGKFGERWGRIAEDRGLIVHTIKLEWGRAVRAADLEAALERCPQATGVLAQLSETSTGVLHPLRELAQAARRKNVLLVADGISAVGISPCPMDEWDVDCLLTGSQKGLLLPPGLSLLAFSARAWEKAAKIKPACYYFDLQAERKGILKNETHFTPAINLIIGLNESLEMFFEAGIEAVFRKQWALTQMTRKGLSCLGLELLAKEHYAWGLTCLTLPVGLNASRVIEAASTRHGAVFAGGQDHMKDSMVRIAHMGWTDWADMLAALHALAESIHACGGYLARSPYLEEAMTAYQAALSLAPGVEP